MIERIALRQSGVSYDTGEVFGTNRTDNYILTGCDWGTARVNATAMVLGNDSTETVVHHAWEPRNVSIAGYILGTDEADVERKKSVAAYRYVGGHWFDLLYNGFSLRFYLTSDITFGRTYEQDNDVWCSFTIAGQCEDVRWHNENITSVSDQTAIGQFSFPLAPTVDDPIVFGTHVAAGTLIYDYSGTVSTGMILRIYKGSARSLVVTNNTQRMSWTSVTGRTGALTIDTRTGFHTASASNIIGDETAGITGDWLRIEPGHNIIQCSLADVDLSVTINTEPQYEVETLP